MRPQSKLILTRVMWKQKGQHYDIEAYLSNILMMILTFIQNFGYELVCFQFSHMQSHQVNWSSKDDLVFNKVFTF